MSSHLETMSSIMSLCTSVDAAQGSAFSEKSWMQSPMCSSMLAGSARPDSCGSKKQSGQDGMAGGTILRHNSCRPGTWVSAIVSRWCVLVWEMNSWTLENLPGFSTPIQGKHSQYWDGPWFLFMCPFQVSLVTYKMLASGQSLNGHVYGHRSSARCFLRIISFSV